MSQVNSYLPECLFLAGKDQEPVRVCREDVVLINPAENYSIVAARGRGLRVGEPFAPLESRSAAERERLIGTLASNAHVLIPDGSATVLLFGELLIPAGLLLAVRMAHAPDSVMRTLSVLRKTDFVPLFLSSPNSAALHERDAATYQALSELFYYLDRVLGASGELGLWTKTLTVANFAGCLLDRVALPMETVKLMPDEELRLTALLLCLFLSLRSELVSPRAEGDYDAVRLHYAVEVCQEDSGADAVGSYRFLELAAFRDISLQKTSQGWALEVNLKRKFEHTAVFSRSGKPVWLRISLQLAS